MNELALIHKYDSHIIKWTKLLVFELELDDRYKHHFDFTARRGRRIRHISLNAWGNPSDCQPCPVNKRKDLLLKDFFSDCL